MRGKGVGLVSQFVKALHVRKIPIRTGQQVVRLAYDGKRVTGVETADDSSIDAKKAVVLATGGYDWNIERQRSSRDFPRSCSIGPRSLTGDGLVLGAELGAPIRPHPEQPLRHARVHDSVGRSVEAAGQLPRRHRGAVLTAHDDR